MQTTMIHKTLLGLTVVALAAAAHAARPLATDDTGVLDQGSCEIEAVASRDKAEGPTVRGRSLQLGCGVGARAQVALGVDREKEDGSRVRGTTTAVKVSLAPDDDASWSASGSVGWINEQGQGREHATTAVSLLHTRSLGPQWLLHANLGHEHDALERRSATTWGLALEHGGWGPVALMGELVGDDRAAPSWNIGLRWTAVPEKWVLDIAYGQQLAGGRPKALSLGLKLAF
jgi:hypothetical protein